MNRDYSLRLKDKLPVALVVNGKLILGHDIAFDKEIWIADRPESQAVTVAVNFFQKKERARRTLKDVSRSTRSDLKHAKRQGAKIATLAQNYNLKESVVKEAIRA